MFTGSDGPMDAGIAAGSADAARITQVRRYGWVAGQVD
jgi:hypothetical protein